MLWLLNSNPDFLGIWGFYLDLMYKKPGLTNKKPESLGFRFFGIVCELFRLRARIANPRYRVFYNSSKANEAFANC